jgi:hypothetical protein
MVNEEMYRFAWRRRHDINERGMYAYIQTKLNIETKAYIKSLDGRSRQTFHITNHFSERWMLSILKDVYKKFGLKQGAFLDSFQKKAEGDLFDEAWLLFLLGFFANITEFFIVLGIIGTIKNDIKRFVEDKVSQGIPASAVITLLALYLTQKNIIRSQTIARTEMTRIMNLSSQVWANTQGKELKKKWIVTLDGKERPSHNAMASYPAIGMKELFLVGGSLMSGPGDGNAPAQEVVNCRCGLMYI